MPSLCRLFGLGALLSAVLLGSSVEGQTYIVKEPGFMSVKPWFAYQRGFDLARDSSGNRFASINSVVDGQKGDFGLFQILDLQDSQRRVLKNSFSIGGFFRASNLNLAPGFPAFAGISVDVQWVNGTKTNNLMKSVQTGTYDWTFISLFVDTKGEMPASIYLSVVTKGGVSGVLDVDNLRLYRGTVTGEWNKPMPAPLSSLKRTVISKGSVPPTCSENVINVEILDQEQCVVDGQVLDVKISLGSKAPQGKQVTIFLATSEGIILSRKKLTFNALTDPEFYIVKIRSTSGPLTDKEGLVLGNAVFVQADCVSSDVPYCTQKVSLKRKVQGHSYGQSCGDPHLKTLDGVSYDFQAPGFFRLVESKNLKIHLYQEKCGPIQRLGLAKAPACIQGAAVSFGESLARFMLDNAGQLQYSSGTTDNKGLSVEKLLGKAEGFRVFLASDQSTYVDINRGIWAQFNNYPHLNVAVQLSPSFKDASTTGLLGNWNGDKADDVTDSAKLTALHGVDGSLFTCMDGCKGIVSSLSENDLSFLTADADQLAHKGYFKVKELLLTPLSPPVRNYSVPSAGRRMRALEEVATGPLLDRETAQKICEDVFSTVPFCDKFVKDFREVYVERMCAADAELLNDLTAVETAKVAYLRECRRVMDSKIAANIGSAAEAAETWGMKAQLTFGAIDSCPNNCSGPSNGECLPSGCKCKSEYSGIDCAIDLKAKLAALRSNPAKVGEATDKEPEKQPKVPETQAPETKAPEVGTPKPTDAGKEESQPARKDFLASIFDFFSPKPRYL